jgi:hypothetical protein
MKKVFYIASLHSLMCLTVNARPFTVEMTQEMQGRCHIIQFPQRWAAPLTDEGHIQPLGYTDNFEFRIVGELSSRFLVALVVRPAGGNRLTSTYTLNKYLIDLSDPRVPVREATDAMWNEGAIVPQAKKVPCR